MSEETTTTHQLVVFSLGEEEYALPTGAVHEIIRYTEPRSVASSIGWIRGVISLRGKIVPVYDLAARLGGARAPARAPQKFPLLEPGARRAGVIAAAVAGPPTPACDSVEPVPSA